MTSIQTVRRRVVRCPHHLRPEGFFLPVDWRWQRAEWRLRTGSRSGERRDDYWTLRALKDLRRSRRGKLGDDLVIEGARKLLWPTDVWLRAEVEARILADQATRAISSATGVCEQAIHAYEALFFDVRRRLHATDWVTVVVLGPQSWELWRPEQVIVAWRCLSYWYGPLAVDLLVYGVDRHELEAIGLPAYWSERSRLPNELQLLLMSRSQLEIKSHELEWTTRLQHLGLYEQPRHFDRPPKDCSLNIGGEYSWGETETRNACQRPAEIQSPGVSEAQIDFNDVEHKLGVGDSGDTAWHGHTGMVTNTSTNHSGMVNRSTKSMLAKAI